MNHLITYVNQSLDTCEKQVSLTPYEKDRKTF